MVFKFLKVSWRRTAVAIINRRRRPKIMALFVSQVRIVTVCTPYRNNRHDLTPRPCRIRSEFQQSSLGSKRENSGLPLSLIVWRVPCASLKYPVWEHDSWTPCFLRRNFVLNDNATHECNLPTKDNDYNRRIVRWRYKRWTRLYWPDDRVKHGFFVLQYISFWIIISRATIPREWMRCLRLYACSLTRALKRFAAYGTCKLDNTSFKALPVRMWYALVNVANFVSREEPVCYAEADANQENNNYCPSKAA